VSDTAYRIMKHLIPGPYTFLFPATKLVPRLVQNPKRKTTGPKPYCVALLDTLGNPIISTSAHLPKTSDHSQWKATSRVELFDRLDKVVDVIVDNGSEPGYQVSTILDLKERNQLLLGVV